MGSKSISGVTLISSMSDRCRSCVTSSAGHVEVTPDIDLDSMKYKGSIIYGSTYMSFWVTKK